MDLEQGDAVAQPGSVQEDLAAQLSSAREALTEAGKSIADVERKLGELLSRLETDSAVTQPAAKSEPAPLAPTDDNPPAPFPAPDASQPRPGRTHLSDLWAVTPEPDPAERAKASELIEGLADKVDVQEVLARIERRLRGLGAGANSDEAP